MAEDSAIELPMFPLGTVLAPGAALPLHVFEPRYLALLEQTMAGDRRFGVVLIERGSEVGGGDVRTDVGTVAEIVEIRPQVGGRFAVLAVGRSRLRVLRWLDDAPFPRALVVEWPDPAADEPAVRTLLAEATRLVRRVLALAAELGATVAPATTEVDGDDVGLASHQLCSLAPLGPADRQELLAQDSVEARLTLLAELLRDEVAVAEQRLALGDGPPDAPG